jgi:hypothetical protein
VDIYEWRDCVGHLAADMGAVFNIDLLVSAACGKTARFAAAIRASETRVERSRSSVVPKRASNLTVDAQSNRAASKTIPTVSSMKPVSAYALALSE